VGTKSINDKQRKHENCLETIDHNAYHVEVS